MRSSLRHIAGFVVIGSTILVVLPAHARVSLMNEDAPQLELRDLVARVIVTPENRTDIDIRVRYGTSNAPTLMVSRRGNTTVLAGSHSAPRPRVQVNVQVNGVRMATAAPVPPAPPRPPAPPALPASGPADLHDDSLPLVFVRVPMNVVIKDSTASAGYVGHSRSLDFVYSGDGEWVIDQVDGPLNVIDTGAGTISVLNAGASLIDSMGASDITVHTTGPLKASLSGAGDFAALNCRDVILQNNGAGDVTFGKVGNLSARLSGAGDMVVQSLNGAFNLTNSGQGDVVVRRINGDVQLELSGGGDVVLENGQIPNFTMRGSGSGDIHFGGVATVVNINNYGTGEVYVRKATGQVTTRVRGSRLTHIGR